MLDFRRSIISKDRNTDMIETSTAEYVGLKMYTAHLPPVNQRLVLVTFVLRSWSFYLARRSCALSM